MTIIYILLALQVADAASTIYFMRRPELGIVEGNPILAPLFKMFGALPTLIVAKGVFAAIIWYYQATLPVEFFWITSAVYCYVVFNNIKLIRAAK